MSTALSDFGEIKAKFIKLTSKKKEIILKYVDEYIYNYSKPQSHDLKPVISNSNESKNKDLISLINMRTKELKALEDKIKTLENNINTVKNKKQENPSMLYYYLINIALFLVLLIFAFMLYKNA